MVYLSGIDRYGQGVASWPLALGEAALLVGKWKFMTVQDIAQDEVRLNLNELEALALQASLREVCYGFCVPDFETTIGASKGSIEALATQFTQWVDEGGPPPSVSLTMHEFRVVSNVLRETVRELGVEAFYTRTGVEPEIAQDMLKEMAVSTHNLPTPLKIIPAE